MKGAVLVDGLKRSALWQAQAKKLPRYVAALEAQLSLAQQGLMQKDAYIEAVDQERAKIVQFILQKGLGSELASALARAIERGEHLR